MSDIIEQICARTGPGEIGDFDRYAIRSMRDHNQELMVALRNLYYKTEVYLKIYPDDKELMTYRRLAAEALELDSSHDSKDER